MLVHLAWLSALAAGLLAVFLAVQALLGSQGDAPVFAERALVAGLSGVIGAVTIAGALALHSGRPWGWWILALLAFFGIGGELASVATLIFQFRNAGLFGDAVSPIPWGRFLANLLPRLLVYLAFIGILLTETVRKSLHPGLHLTWPRRIPLLVALALPMGLALFAALMVPSIARSITTNTDGLQQQLEGLEKARQENDQRLLELLKAEQAMLASRLQTARTPKERAEIQRLMAINRLSAHRPVNSRELGRPQRSVPEASRPPTSPSTANGSPTAGSSTRSSGTGSRPDLPPPS